jgi:hypothetical protein
MSLREALRLQFGPVVSRLTNSIFFPPAVAPFFCWNSLIELSLVTDPRCGVGEQQTDLDGFLRKGGVPMRTRATAPVSAVRE